MNASMQAWRTTLVQFWQRSPASPLWRWWLGELASLLPRPLLQAFTSGIEWHAIEWMDGEWQLRAMHASAPAARWSDALSIEQQQALIKEALANVSQDALRLAFLVPDAWVLRRHMSFPAAARDQLKQVAAFEIDRQTPFRAAQVFHDIGLVAVTANGTQLQTELVAVPRSLIDPLLARLRELGVVLDAMDAGVNGARLGVNLLPASDKPQRIDRRFRLNLGLTAGAILLLILCMLQWVHNRESALDVMRSEVDRMKAEVQAVSVLRQTLQDHAGATGFLAQRKRDGTAALSILQDLSVRLPQTAWLERLSIDHGGQVGMQGQGTQAASLLEALKGSASLAEPAFQGSIQKDPSTGKERFFMVAQLRKPNDAKPKAPAAAGSAP